MISANSATLLPPLRMDASSCARENICSALARARLIENQYPVDHCVFYCLKLKGRYTALVIRNVIFDWSGTLVDDLPAVWQATNYVLSQAEREEMTLEQFRAEFCLPFTRFYDRFVPHIALPQLEAW